ncbi:Serine/threonine-protein phosphatase 6 regulatory subunit 3 [Heterocephalus glaber]|uniref:Serine/threonine-protein phosphatase 6 regulatory subunit 3 n=1 Tax=Heterocephalus glaber TaxID=10181 RepID=G5C1A1_HETGA|nr:Serine/threonine-protein phosphatase 6 regulatory subunit 3 [Heterocephalus glaber]
MFWKFDLHSSSYIDTLLEREDVTLKLMEDEEDVLQECKAQNCKLIEFLLKAECLEDLVSFIIEEPPQDIDEKIKYKYSNISCELLTSEVSQMNDRLGEDESLLMKLYSFLLNDSPLNPLLASFFSEVLSILISRKPEQIVDFLKKKCDFVELIIKHIGTSDIMDLLLRLLTCIEPPQPRKDVLNWLNEEKIIQRLVEIVHPSQEDRHSNASQSCFEIVRLSRDQMLQVQNSTEPDPLLATLEKQEIIEQLLSNIFHKEKNESAIDSSLQQFGFNDEKFGDKDDIGSVSFDRVSDINFILNTNESGNITCLKHVVRKEYTSLMMAALMRRISGKKSTLHLPQNPKEDPAQGVQTVKKVQILKKKMGAKQDLF